MLLSHTFTNHYALCASMLWYWIFKLLLTCTSSVIEVLKVKLTLSDSWTKGFHSRAYNLMAVDLLNIRDSNSGIVRRLAAAASPFPSSQLAPLLAFLSSLLREFHPLFDISRFPGLLCTTRYENILLVLRRLSLQDCIIVQMTRSKVVKAEEVETARNSPYGHWGRYPIDIPDW